MTTRATRMVTMSNPTERTDPPYAKMIIESDYRPRIIRPFAGIIESDDIEMGPAREQLDRRISRDAD